MNEHEDRSDDVDYALHVLALNSGSSSLKFGLYRVCAAKATRLFCGEAERMGEADSVFLATAADGRTLLRETVALAGPRDVMARIDELLRNSVAPLPQAVAHRVVHGGPLLRDHCRIDAAVERDLEAASAFAPLHMSAALALIREAECRFPDVPQIACFDTTFHRNMPEVARTLPLPAALREQGIQRYGFHGLSCESIVRQLAGEAGGVPRRLVIAHLGNGASITAVLDGVSIDTSMGLTPTGGIVMGTRSGDLDPGVLVYLAREKRFDAQQLEDLIDHRSGLLGLSGTSSDMRTLHATAAAQADARLAIRIFCQSVRKQLGAMSVVLDGIDLIVFTGGIGEHDTAIRAEICGGLASIGVAPGAADVDETGDSKSDRPRCQVRVLPSLEDEQIAMHAGALAARTPREAVHAP